jgi:hypothetical protein
MVFLDPDDEFVGGGMPEALEVAKSRNSDIVQFGCTQKPASGRRPFPCWKEPKFSTATGDALLRAVVRGQADWHMHRKIFRTSVVRIGISFVPEQFRRLRICRHEDILQYLYIIGLMRGQYYKITAVGEIRYSGLKDNSMSTTYESANATIDNLPVIMDSLNWMWRIRDREIWQDAQ